MGKKLTDSQAGWFGGLNTVADPSMLRPDQARQLANMRLSAFGGIVKRLGTQQTVGIFQATHDTAGSVGGGIFWPLKAKVYTFAADNSTTAINLWYTTYSANPFSHTWTNAGALPQYRPVIFTDGTNEIMYVAGDNATLAYKYDGTTIAALGASTAKVAGLCVYNDRLWGWNGASNTHPNSIYYSNLSSAVGSTGGDSLGDAGAGGGEIIVRTFGMSTIVACAPVGTSLLIFHQKGISRLTGYGQSDISVTPQALTADVGMGRATANGICVYDNVAYFATDRGVYKATEGGVAPLSTPDKPDPTYALLQAGTTDPSKFTLIFNRQYNEVWVWITGIGIYVYNTILESWSGPFTGTYASSSFRGVWEVWEGLGTMPIGTPYGNSHIWFSQFNGPAAATFQVQEADRAGVYKDDSAAGTPTSGGTAVSATIQPHRFFCNERAYSKAWRWVQLTASLSDTSTTPVVKCNSVHGGTNTTTVSVSASTQDVYYVGPTGIGPWLDVIITDAGVSASQYATIGVESYMLGQR